MKTTVTSHSFCYERQLGWLLSRYAYTCKQMILQ